MFRTLHTIKGTAQTFGLEAAGSLAHDIEHLLAARSGGPVLNENELRELLLAGMGTLTDLLSRPETVVPPDLIARLRAARSDSPVNTDFNEELALGIPGAVTARLSEQEKANLAAALAGDQDICGLEVEFPAAAMAAEFTRARALLTAAGEIIAVFPAEKPLPAIGFLFLLAAADHQLENLLHQLGARLVFQKKADKKFADDVSGLLSAVIDHGQTLARGQNKRITFHTDNRLGGKKLSARRLKSVFDILVHLIRNAVDHGAEPPEARSAAGKDPAAHVVIKIGADKEQLVFSVSDDGRGIDPDEIRRKATKENLFADGQEPDEAGLLELIFRPEFSTACSVTLTSGRGVGLDAVKAEVENLGGEISIKTRSNKGTTFEIYLPDEE